MGSRLKIAVVILTLLFVFVAHATRVHGATLQLRILSPENESVVTSKVMLEMVTSDFVLDAKPSDAADHGVIALYLDGKFYNTVASSSATVYLPRVGTHRIDAELVHVSRSPIAPSTRQSIYVHNQKKTPSISITNILNGTTVYSDKPVLHVDVRKESFEDQNAYYQVFVDGVVDGDSTQFPDVSRYQLKNSLKPGKHTVRLALYSENGRPYVPVVDALADILYEPVSPSIVSVALSSASPMTFKAQIADFSLPESGYLRVATGTQEWLFSSSEGVLTGLTDTKQQITFELVDVRGDSLVPPVLAQKKMVLSNVPSAAAAEQSQATDFIFYTPKVSDQPQLNLILFALAQAVGIILLGFYFHFKHRHQ